MFSFKSTVRYSETDSKGKLSIPSIINYFQDCTTCHSNMLGVGVDYLKEKNKAWVLNSWQIEFLDEVSAFEEIEVGTWSYGFNKAYGYRNFVMNHNEKRVVNANSLWIYTDTESFMPVKVPTEEGEVYGYEPKLEMKEFDRKIKVTGEMLRMEPFTIRKYHIDTNGHVNNGRYIEFATEYADCENIRYLRAEYKKSAVYGDEIYPVLYTEDNVKTVVFEDKDGKVYANVQFMA